MSLVKHELVGILRRVELAHVRPDAKLTEHAFHAESARLVRNDWHDVTPDVLVADQDLQNLHERHRRRDLALVGALQEAIERGQLGNREWIRLATPRWQITA